MASDSSIFDESIKAENETMEGNDSLLEIELDKIDSDYEDSEPVEDFEYGKSEKRSFRSKMMSFASTRFFQTFLGLGSLFLMGIFTLGVKIGIMEGEVSNTIPLGIVLLTLSLNGFFIITLGFFIEKVSFTILKKTRGEGVFWYFINELGYHISFPISLALTRLLITFYSKDFHFANDFNLNLTIVKFLGVTFFFSIFLILQRALALTISLNFNYGIYLNRIKKCLYCYFFLHLVNRANEFNSKKDDYMDDYGVLITGSNKNLLKFNTFIFSEKFREDDKKRMTFSAKQLLIKEFKSLSANISEKGSFLHLMNEIRKKSYNKALKLFKAVSGIEIKRFRDFSVYFQKSSMFNQLTEALNIKGSEEISFKFLYNITEKAFKERYLIGNSLKQLNAAINRVSMCIKLFSFVFYLIMLYVSATGEINMVAGVMSTIFSTSFIVQLMNENVVQSLMFLFIIHPYDVGDRVLIKMNGEEQNLMVAELNVFSTQFYKWDGTAVFVPNKLLVNTPISNVRRSGSTMQTQVIQINTKTNPLRLELLRKKLIAFVKKEPHKYTDYILVNYEKIEDSQKLYIKIIMQYRTNFQNHENYLKLRSHFIYNLNLILLELGIVYELPLQKIKLQTKGDAEIKKSYKMK